MRPARWCRALDARHHRLARLDGMKWAITCVNPHLAYLADLAESGNP
ncbi:MAG: hypothetical protein ACRDTA_18205 [Pseudonocardiaceae bacterium]